MMNLMRTAVGHILKEKEMEIISGDIVFASLVFISSTESILENGLNMLSLFSQLNMDMPTTT